MPGSKKDNKILASKLCAMRFHLLYFSQQGIHAINLGDSGFIVVRDGCTVFHSPVQQHGFNFTYQMESGDNGDLPSSGQVS